MPNRLFPVLAFGFALAAASQCAAADKPAKSDSDKAAKASLKSGEQLPGPFQVLSVTGPRAGKFHAPVCEYGVNPFVLVFVKDAKNLEGVGKFLQELDALAVKHPDARLGACAIFLDDGGYRKAFDPKGDADGKALAKAADEREALEARLRDWAGSAGLKLKHVAISLDSSGGPENYQISPEADATVLLCYKLKLAADPMIFKKMPENWGDVLKPVEKLATHVERLARPKK